MRSSDSTSSTPINSRDIPGYFLNHTGEARSIIHEVGGAIMGADAKKSVTNQWNQCWEVPNLLLNDGSAFCSNADKNPTLTIMALAWRATDHLIEEMRKGNL
ncbi:MAG: hypothetical protein RJB43_874 [Verrucomicrobiota bacterium]